MPEPPEPQSDKLTPYLPPTVRIPVRQPAPAELTVTEKDLAEHQPAYVLEHLKQIRTFYDAHRTAIINLLSSQEYRANPDLDFFYRLAIYGTGFFDMEHRRAHPGFNSAAEAYNKDIAEIEARFRDFDPERIYQITERDLPPGDNGKTPELAWIDFHVNGNIDYSLPIGKVYVNVPPAAAASFMADMIREMYYAHVTAEIKLPKTADESGLNRRDKLVLYFNQLNGKADEKLVLETLQGLYPYYRRDLEGRPIPWLTSPVFDKSNIPMGGLAFVEDSSPVMRCNPLVTTHSRAVREVLSNLWNESTTFPEGSRSGITSAYRQAATDAYLDPGNPAYLKRKPGEPLTFPLFRKNAYLAEAISARSMKQTQ